MHSDESFVTFVLAVYNTRTIANPALALATRKQVGGEPQWSGVEWKGARGGEGEDEEQAPFLLVCLM